jgi:pyridoxal phosphate enzyme (YggS family)
MENNIKEIKTRISQKCLALGRDLNNITLVAVSKKHSLEKIDKAEKLGLKDFGENKAQELKQKAEDYKKNINWHFIGHLQTNKAKDVVQFAHLIHSVDSIKLAKEINKRAQMIEKKQNILLEINTGGEDSKFGLNTNDQINELAEYCKELPNVNLLGLMTMAPYTDNENIIRECFKKLSKIFVKLNQKGFNLTELSMGMTNDYEIAIEEGATILRIGTAIFGERN